jgi:hypothetical protein
MSIISPHTGQGIDGTTWRMAERINSKIPLIPISRVNDFKFNTDLYQVADYVLFDMTELDWNTPYEETGTHLFGENTQNFNHFNTDDWKKFDEWVATNPPKLYMKRELLKKDVTENIIPIDYFNWCSRVTLQTREEFNKRVFDAFYFWGRSHEGRLQIHGDIWKGASKHGYSVCDNFIFLQDFVNQEQGSKWCTLWMPHYKRIDISMLLSINGISKISIAPFGAGRKTFRHLEASVNSAMLTWEDNFAWAYPWVHGENCIKCEQGKEVETIIEWLGKKELYDAYIECVHNANRYRPETYIPNYIEKKINEFA